ncbi:MAG: hypothetical protein KIS87_08090, partial [Phycisphaeraceae bacterium]|nr:hypothetical protein [Phycisphaeraceae bacterium]
MTAHSNGTPAGVPHARRSWHVIESTLREGEQFANAFFTTGQKIRLATMLDAFGADYLELTSPAA